MPAMTSAASAICGTHFGETKLVTSILRKPGMRDSMSISAIFSAVGIGAAFVLQAVARAHLEHA